MNNLGSTSTKNIVAFTGGGTGGHIYPGIAVIQNLQKILNDSVASGESQSACRIIWIGACTGMDRSIVESFGIEFFGIKCGKLRRYFSPKNFFDVFNIIAGIFQAVKILKKTCIDAKRQSNKQKVVFLFSKGGFVSVPPVIAAMLLNIPIWTHESDFSPGLATKINSHFAQKICLAYEKTACYFNKAMQRKLFVCGNPVRPVFYSGSINRGKEYLRVSDDSKILLVLGGSQGAKEINDLIKSSLSELTKYYFVVHQTGKQEISIDDYISAICGTESKNYLPLEYIFDQMPNVLAAADLVIGRSGAGTVWECAALGRPMILIPLCGQSTRGDQVQNAQCFTDLGAAIMLVHPSTKTLCDTIVDLQNNPHKLSSMKASASKAGKINAGEIIAKSIVDFLQNNEAKQ
ncbi:MAG: undecaprenyldiphospho-muramoylpentapeptide beta-N-acetylglucosaminyltransferase [Termitinemataceae bacterium]|nr:MAG: undecaprenyldiphospho-muramoylpentapeptide beta-N-acetylglucosaminyltransferase [Termitinemataceae bacterium]